MANKKHLFFKSTFFKPYQVDWKAPEDLDLEVWHFEKIPHLHSPRKLEALVQSPEQPKGVVLMLHPLVKKAKGFFLSNGSYQAYLDQQWAVVLLDFNGLGASEDVGFDFHQDALSAQEWINKVFPGLTQVVHGISFGGGHAMVALEKESHQFAGAIFENPFPSIGHFYKKQPLLYALLRFLMLFFAWEANNRPIKSNREMKNIEEALWIFCEKDELLGDSIRNQFLDETNIPAKVWIAQNTAHNEAFTTHTERFKTEIKEYLENVLKRKGQRST